MHTTLVSTAVLAAHLADHAWRIIDVRHDLSQPERWGEDQYKAAHVSGAVFAHLDRDLSAAKTGRNGRHPLPSPEVAAERFARLGIAADTQVVAYDQGPGMYASRLWWMLRWLGHEAVAVLDGGFDKWRREGRPVTAEIRTPPRGGFAQRRLAPVVNANEILASLGNALLTVVDARTPERFRGETEPLDPVAGHIPGARNRPFGLNVNPDGTFKPRNVLREEFAQLLGTTPLASVAHQCGSGVTACHNILAMEYAGLPGTRLYPGSWSEWCADPSRPVATGPA